jgi:hypothetical protein
MNTYQAISDVNIKYTYQHGGGLKGRTVKAGDIVTVIGRSIEIDTPCVSCIELLHKITEDSFKAFFRPVS